MRTTKGFTFTSLISCLWIPERNPYGKQSLRWQQQRCEDDIKLYIKTQNRSQGRLLP